MKPLNLIVIFLVVLIYGCKNECETASCRNNGVCVDGKCLCLPGYSGNYCEVKDKCFNVSCENGSCDEGICKCDAYYNGNNCEVEKYKSLIGSFYGYYGCLGSGGGVLKEYIGTEYLPNDISVFQFKLNGYTFKAKLRNSDLIAFDTDTLVKTDTSNHYAEGNLNSDKIYITIYEYDTGTNQIFSQCVFQGQ